MEKSHYATKAANQVHTQHSSTKPCTSTIVQQYQHWYQNIQHKYARKIANEATAEVVRDTMNSASTTSSLATKRARRESWMASTTANAHSEWQATGRRVGRFWMPQPNTMVEANIDVVDDTLNVDEDNMNV